MNLLPDILDREVPEGRRFAAGEAFAADVPLCPEPLALVRSESG